MMALSKRALALAPCNNKGKAPGCGKIVQLRLFWAVCSWRLVLRVQLQGVDS